MSDKENALATASAKNPRFKSGKNTRVVEFKAALTSANSDAGDLLILASGLSYADRISGLFPNALTVPALTSATDNDLGFYYKDETGAYVEIDKDILWDGVSLASASTFGNLLTAKNSSLDHSKNIGELLGLGVDMEPVGGIYLVLTMNTANTATATVTIATHIDIATTAG